jgi:hypothetical protein
MVRCDTCLLPRPAASLAAAASAAAVLLGTGDNSREIGTLPLAAALSAKRVLLLPLLGDAGCCITPDMRPKLEFVPRRGLALGVVEKPEPCCGSCGRGDEDPAPPPCAAAALYACACACAAAAAVKLLPLLAGRSVPSALKLAVLYPPVPPNAPPAAAAMAAVKLGLLLTLLLPCAAPTSPLGDVGTAAPANPILPLPGPTATPSPAGYAALLCPCPG